MPKPHLVSYRERIAIDGEPISRERFAAALEAVMPAIDRVTARIGPPTEFEALTAAAFTELAGAGIDLALVEVGLGGRLDATNTIEKPVASVITPISMDHMEFLGPTLTSIAGEKAAIIKRGAPVVCAEQADEAMAVIDRARALPDLAGADHKILFSTRCFKQTGARIAKERA